MGSLSNIKIIYSVKLVIVIMVLVSRSILAQSPEKSMLDLLPDRFKNDAPLLRFLKGPFIKPLECDSNNSEFDVVIRFSRISSWHGVCQKITLSKSHLIRDGFRCFTDDKNPKVVTHRWLSHEIQILTDKDEVGKITSSLNVTELIKICKFASELPLEELIDDGPTTMIEIHANKISSVFFLNSNQLDHSALKNILNKELFGELPVTSE